MDSHQAKKRRPSRPSGQSGVRLDGDMLLLMHGATDSELVVTPTATAADYTAADDKMVGHNSNMIEARDQEIGAGQWDGECGVWRLNLDNHDDLAIQAYREFRDHFRDGVLALKAPQEQDPTTIQGGWLKPYSNTLSRDQAEALGLGFKAGDMCSLSRSSGVCTAHVTCLFGGSSFVGAHAAACG